MKPLKKLLSITAAWLAGALIIAGIATLLNLGYKIATRKQTYSTRKPDGWDKPKEDTSLINHSELQLLRQDSIKIYMKYHTFRTYYERVGNDDSLKKYSDSSDKYKPNLINAD